MKKTAILLLALALVLTASACGRHGTDIIGVTSLMEKNIVVR